MMTMMTMMTEAEVWGRVLRATGELRGAGFGHTAHALAARTETIVAAGGDPEALDQLVEEVERLASRVDGDGDDD